MITNESKYDVQSAVVYLYPVKLPELLTIKAERINVPIPDHSLNTSEERIDLDIRNLRSGESRTYYIDFR